MHPPSTHAPTSHQFISQRLPLHYVDWGNHGAPLLLLLHGGLDHCRSWDWTAEQLRHDWHVIAPDLRGHGDSAWSPDGHYNMDSYVYDLARLVRQLDSSPVTIVGHSLGGNIAIRFTGLYPEQVSKLVSIEGLGLSPTKLTERDAVPLATRWRDWIEARHAASARKPRLYASMEDALARMKAVHANLSDAQARHLTWHGARQNEDGKWSWKYDNYLKVFAFLDIPQSEIQSLWATITCPTLLVYGAESWASNPERDGRARHFQNARVLEVAKAGHWPHHDQFLIFISELKHFLHGRT